MEAAHGGLPANLVQADLAIAASRPSTLYATLSTTEESQYGSGKGNGLYRSDDAGETWHSVTTDDRALMKIGGGDLMVPVVDPTNPDVLYVASIVTMKSGDGGKTWTWLRGAPGGDDYHEPVDQPEPTRRSLVLVSDQGAVVTVNGGETWSSWYNQPTAQLYHVTRRQRVPVSRVQRAAGERLGVRREPQRRRPDHVSRLAARSAPSEYGYAAPDPLRPRHRLRRRPHRVTRFDRRTGQVQNVTPSILRGPDYRVVRTHADRVLADRPEVALLRVERACARRRTAARRWTAISPTSRAPTGARPPMSARTRGTTAAAASRRGVIYTIAPSPIDSDRLWAGTDDGLCT